MTRRGVRRLAVVTLAAVVVGCGGPARFQPSDGFQPAYVTREMWHAGPLQPNHDEMLPIYRITVHHTGIAEQYGQPAAAVARDVQRLHQDERGWADVGYHFIIGGDGAVAEGRPIGVHGAHAVGNNGGNIGISVAGDFRVVAVPAVAARALAALLEELRSRYRLGRAVIFTHRELKDTECPGDRLQAVVEGLRAEPTGD